MNELMTTTDRWRAEHPGSAAAAVRYDGLSGVDDTLALATVKRDLEASLIERWRNASKQDLLADPTLGAYEQFYRRFGQNYHVAMQIRSVAQKGKPIPARNVIIEAMFMTELACGVLAAAQDLDQIALPIVVDGTDGTEEYTRYDGVSERCKPGDQAMRESAGNILTSITQGPTSYGLVSEKTNSVVYCFYFPAGVLGRTIDAALATLDQFVRAGNPEAQVIESVIVRADQG